MSGMRVEWDVAIPMRDGTILHADVYSPTAQQGPYPVLLQRTPYDKRLTGHALVQIDILRAIHRGYAVVIQDVRGRFASEGDFAPFHQEIADGYDTVEWCGRQLWSTGCVGMYGASYVGAVQWLAAIGNPPHLRCIVPAFTSSDHYEGWTYQGGALQTLFVVSWLLPFLTPPDVVRHVKEMERVTALTDELVGLVDGLGEVCDRFDRTGVLPVAAEYSHYLADWLEHPMRDEFWTPVSIEDRYSEVSIPSLNVGSWYDTFIDGTIRNFLGVRENAATVEAREGSRLLVGPWIHDGASSSQAGTYDSGVGSSRQNRRLGYDLDGEVLDFFDVWLKSATADTAAKARSCKRVKLFVMGPNIWRDEGEWPRPADEIRLYYLSSDGHANTDLATGKLTELPLDNSPPECYRYDPENPVPTVGGQLCCYWARFPAGGFDQRGVESRDDVLVYTTNPFGSAVEVNGPIVLHLWAATSAADTDFTAKLVDVSPDGAARNLTDGILRARFRLGTAEEQPITPGMVYEYRINLGWTCNVFPADHRMRLEISSSNFPRFERNSNTGRASRVKDEMVVAEQTIYHDIDRPSHLVVPIRPLGNESS